MSITVSVRTVSGATSSVNTEPTTTIKELKTLFSEQCGLGFCTTLVYKGAPLKKESATLTEINYTPGETLVGVFKKEAPKEAPAPVPVPVTPVPQAAAAAATTTPAPVLQTPVKPAAAAAVPAAVSNEPPIDYTADWQCPMCTYINIGARTVCVMCFTQDPNKARGKKATTQQPPQSVIDPARIEQRLQQMGGAQMDEDTKNAVRAMLEQDLRDEDEAAKNNPTGANGGGIRLNASMSDGSGSTQIDLEALLQMCEQDPQQKAALCREFGLPEDSSVDLIRSTITQAAQQSPGELNMDEEQYLQTLLSDPAIAAQLNSVVAEHGNSPEALQEALLQLLQGGMLDGDEDDEDVEIDEDMMMDDE
jgi:hypothetical protein